MNVVYPIEKNLAFHDAEGFTSFFSRSNFKKDVYLLLEEIDVLLAVPNICNDFLSELRV